MRSILRVAASGMLAQQFSLETIANNLANMNTTGYKRTRAQFQDLPPEPLRHLAGETFPIDETLNDVLVGTGVMVSAAQRLFTPGQLRVTNQPLDVAINGDGFLQVQLPDGGIGYTRDGALGIDGDGRLVTENGYRLMSDIVIPPNLYDIQIGGSGAVVARNAAGEIQQLGTLQLAGFPNPAGLSAIGGNLLQTTGASGAPVVGNPGSEGLGDLVAGALESSNVDVAEETTKMIEAQRVYEMSVKAVQTLDQMLGMVNSMRG